jgi:flagellar basal-body rod protein FlgB
MDGRIAGMGHGSGRRRRTRYRVPVMPSLDGNTVELSTEQTLFAEKLRSSTARPSPSSKGASTPSAAR